MKTMKAVVFKGKDQMAVEEVPRPAPRAGEAVIRITPGDNRVETAETLRSLASLRRYRNC